MSLKCGANTFISSNRVNNAISSSTKPISSASSRSASIGMARLTWSTKDASSAFPLRLFVSIDATIAALLIESLSPDLDRVLRIDVPFAAMRSSKLGRDDSSLRNSFLSVALTLPLLLVPQTSSSILLSSDLAAKPPNLDTGSVEMYVSIALSPIGFRDGNLRYQEGSSKRVPVA